MHMQLMIRLKKWKNEEIIAINTIYLWKCNKKKERKKEERSRAHPTSETETSIVVKESSRSLPYYIVINFFFPFTFFETCTIGNATNWRQRVAYKLNVTCMLHLRVHCDTWMHSGNSQLNSHGTYYHFFLCKTSKES